jgi:phosphoesterase RecJ-like protein
MTTPASDIQPPNNRGETDYPACITRIAGVLEGWDGPIVIATHSDPDGDALGSALALKRALSKLGKETLLPLAPPHYLEFLAQSGELSEPLAALPPDALVAVLDVEVSARLAGVPVTGTAVAGAAFTVVVDHHGTNNRAGDLVCVEPSCAATAQMVKDIIDALPLSWTPELATPCLTGLLTDTGNFRFGNTSPEVLHAAGELIACGVAYAELTDRLQWRHPDYFRMLGKVMSTVTFPLGGLVALAELTQAMRAEVGPTDDDSNDYVGLIRYAEGSVVALFLREEPSDGQPRTKVSVRARSGVSAQAICMALGGGGHVAAAGAAITAELPQARALALEAVRAELVRADYGIPE